jgi:ABC-2 type transport system ATP-binding protein
VGGFVETPRFYPYLTGRQNLAILAGPDGGDADDLIDQAIESAGLAGARRQKVRGTHSGCASDPAWPRPCSAGRGC